MAVPSVFFPSRAGAAGLALLLGGCASMPPPLPPARDTAGTVAPGDATRCTAILGELAGLDAQMQALAERIAADRNRDQAAGYAAVVSAVLFPPTVLILAADTNAENRIEVNRLYERRDAVLVRAAQEGCALPDRPTSPRASGPG
jgi:hypothetical protein